jgi:hypothetical protein
MTRQARRAKAEEPRAWMLWLSSIAPPPPTDRPKLERRRQDDVDESG